MKSREDIEIERILNQDIRNEKDLDRHAWYNTKLLVDCGEDPYHACIELGYYTGVK